MTPTPPLPPIPPPPMPQPVEPNRNTFLRGFGFIMFLNVALFPLIAIVGVTQLTYVIPIAIKAYRLGQTARLQGILVAAGLTILLNGACFVAVLSNFNPR